jgi:diguanylate cyclase (GGDEF)-like protein
MNFASRVPVMKAAGAEQAARQPAWLVAAEPTLPPGVCALLLVMEHAAVQVAVFDPSDRLAWANPSYRTTYGLAEGEQPLFADLIRRNFREGRGVRIDCGDPERFLADALTRRRVVEQRAFATDLVNGQWLWIHETLLPDGWLVSVATDITPLKRLESSLRTAHDEALAASRTDPLTGLCNRRWILELAESEGELAATRGAPVSYVVIDIDHLKEINDTGGHGTGDDVLRLLATEAMAFFRRGDSVGRPGGDEFLVVMPTARVADCVAAVERFRDRLTRRLLVGDVPAFTFTAGVAALVPGEAVEETLRRADRALYEAKAAGRGFTRASA